MALNFGNVTCLRVPVEYRICGQKRILQHIRSDDPDMPSIPSSSPSTELFEISERPRPLLIGERNIALIDLTLAAETDERRKRRNILRAVATIAV